MPTGGSRASCRRASCSPWAASRVSSPARSPAGCRTAPAARSAGAGRGRSAVSRSATASLVAIAFARGSVGRRSRVGRRVGRHRRRVGRVHRAHRRPAHDAARHGIRGRVVLAGARASSSASGSSCCSNSAPSRAISCSPASSPWSAVGAALLLPDPPAPAQSAVAREPRALSRPARRSARPRLRLAARRPARRQHRKRARHRAAALLPAVRPGPGSGGGRGRSAAAHRHLHASSSSRRRSCREHLRPHRPARGDRRLVGGRPGRRRALHRARAVVRDRR